MKSPFHKIYSTYTSCKLYFNLYTALFNYVFVILYVQNIFFHMPYIVQEIKFSLNHKV